MTSARTLAPQARPKTGQGRRARRTNDAYAYIVTSRVTSARGGDKAPTADAGANVGTTVNMVDGGRGGGKDSDDRDANNTYRSDVGAGAALTRGRGGAKSDDDADTVATGGRGGGKSDDEDTPVVGAPGGDELPPDVPDGTTTLPPSTTGTRMKSPPPPSTRWTWRRPIRTPTWRASSSARPPRTTPRLRPSTRPTPPGTRSPCC